MMMRRFAAMLVLAASMSSWAPGAWAQGATAAKDPPTATDAANALAQTPEAIREMVSRMSDAEVRQLLIERLDAVAAKEAEAAKLKENTNFAEEVVEVAVNLGHSTADAIYQAPRILDGVIVGVKNYLAKVGPSGFARFLLSILAAIAAGLAVEWIVNRFAAGWRRQFNREEPPDTLAETLGVLGRRFILDMGGLFAFFLVTRSVGVALIPDAERPLAYTIFLNLVVVPRLVAALSRFLLAPRRPQLRLLATDDWTASFLHRQIVGIMALVGFSIFMDDFLLTNGVGMTETRLAFWLNTAICGWLCYVIVKARTGLAQSARGWDPDVTPTEAAVADAYPWGALALTIATWIFAEALSANGYGELVANGEQYLTLGLLFLTPTMDTMVRGLVRHLVPPMKGEGAIAERAYLSTKRSYIRIGRAIIFGLTAIVIASIWDVDLTNLAAAGMGAQIAARLITVTIVLAIGYLAWEGSTLFFNRRLASELTDVAIGLEGEDAGEPGGMGGSRMTTVLPLLRMAAQGLIIVLTVLIALGNLGVDITPLLAGAGIAGLAIGFGAQTLVRDIVSGLFFLIDDAFRVGEYLVIGTTVGTVEKISVRSLQLRHHEGPVHTIPYGSIDRVTNNSRDWVIVKIRFTVPFDTNVNTIKKIFKKIGAEMLETPYKDDIIQTFKSQGVNSVDDVGIVVRGKFMARPGKQWAIRKDVYARVQKAFAENGIEFARREVRVTIPGYGAKDIDDEAANAIAGAAAEASGAADAPARRA